MKKHFCIVFLIVFLVQSTKAWSINITDEWSYVITNVQSTQGALGIILLSVNFILGWFFYTKIKHKKQQIVQEHTDDLEDSIIARGEMDLRMQEAIIKIKMLTHGSQ